MVLIPVLAALLMSPLQVADRYTVTVKSYMLPRAPYFKTAKRRLFSSTVVSAYAGVPSEIMSKVSVFDGIPSSGTKTADAADGRSAKITQAFSARNGMGQTDFLAIRPTAVDDGFDIAIAFSAQPFKDEEVATPLSIHIKKGESAMITIRSIGRMVPQRVYFASVSKAGS